MDSKRYISANGFTLLETVVAMGLSLLLIAGAAKLFSTGVSLSFLASQRAEMQQDVRAAQDLLVRDISMAGAGLPPGGVALATGGGAVPIYGCDQNSCHLGGTPPKGLAFPGGTTPYMYWIVPGNQAGATVTTGQGATDAITVVQADLTFPWSDYTVSFNTNGTKATFALVTSPPAPVIRVSDPAYGLKTGDLVLFTGTSGGNSTSAVGEVTADVTGAGSPYTVQFAASDALGFNQSAAKSASLAQLKNLTGVTATRIYAVSYYISMESGTPTLMREVNGRPASPLAENIVGMQFSYDTYDSNGNLLSTPVPATPNLIRKVNVTMNARSAEPGVQGYQSMSVETSVSVRNMSFENRYD